MYLAAAASNAMVWTRGMQRDYDEWAEHGAKGWSYADVLPVFQSQEDWEGGANAWRGAGGPIHIRAQRILIPQRQPSSTHYANILSVIHLAAPFRRS